MDAEEAGTRHRLDAAPKMTEAEFRELYQRLRAGLPWDAADRRGALNYLTPQDVLAATAEVRLGRSVSLAAPIETWTSADNPDPAVHQMTGTAQTADQAGMSFGADRIAMNVHGNADSHIDALRHVIFDRTLYNDVPADQVSQSGAAELSIEIAADGIVGRACCWTSLACAGPSGSSQAIA